MIRRLTFPSTLSKSVGISCARAMAGLPGWVDPYTRTLIAADTFDHDANLLLSQVPSTPWTTKPAGEWRINSVPDTLTYGNGSGLDAFGLWTAVGEPFLGNQYARITVGQTSSAYFSGVAVRGYYNSLSDYKLYVFSGNADGSAGEIALIDRSTPDPYYITLKTVTGVTWNAGDIMELRAVGNVLSVLKNNVLVDSVTDNTLTVGRPGLYAFYNSPNPGPVLFPDWEGGNIS